MTGLSLPHWDDEPDVWDTLILGGITFPGVAKVEIERARKVDSKSAKGKNKATITDQGVEPAKVTLTITVCSSEELAALAMALEAVEPKSGDSPMTPYDIIHPMASLRDVRSVAIIKIKGPELANGLMTITIDCTEWNAPAKGGLGGAFVGHTASGSSDPTDIIQKGLTDLAAQLSSVTTTPTGSKGSTGSGSSSIPATPDQTYTK